MFPASYPLNMECIYNLVASPGNMIEVRVTYGIEETENCVDDYLEIRAKDGAGNLVAELCGSDIKTVVVPDSAWVKFKSDNETTGSGFQMKYQYGE